MAQIPREIQKLFDQYPSLKNFAQVEIWDNLAKSEIEKLTSYINSTDEVIGHKTGLLEQARRERQQKPAILRIFSSNKEELKLDAEIKTLQALNEDHRNLIEEIQSKIDITPNNAEEQAALLKELSLERKELELKKREVNEQMRQIRTAARQQSASLPGPGKNTGKSKSTASARRKIRYQKESALSPHEDARSEIESELIKLEKDILWVERFS